MAKATSDAYDEIARLASSPGDDKDDGKDGDGKKKKRKPAPAGNPGRCPGLPTGGPVGAGRRAVCLKVQDRGRVRSGR
jgi:hypothetical protein